MLIVEFYHKLRPKPNTVSKIKAALQLIYTVFQKKTPTHIIGYKLKSSCLILIIFDTNIPHIIWHHMTA